MDPNIIKSADAIGLFCRLHMNSKKNLPIRASEMGVLIFTHQQSVPVTPMMISQFFKIAKPSVTSMVNALIHQKYLLKEPSESDGRSYALKTTEKGKHLVESTYDEYFKTIELLKEKMGASAFDQFLELILMANGILMEDL